MVKVIFENLSQIALPSTWLLVLSGRTLILNLVLTHTHFRDVLKCSILDVWQGSEYASAFTCSMRMLHMRNFLVQQFSKEVRNITWWLNHWLEWVFWKFHSLYFDSSRIRKILLASNFGKMYFLWFHMP